LLELIHSKGLVYSNLCPEDILLVDRDLSKMCFPSLYHCIGKNITCPGLELSESSNLSFYDIRIRDTDYISPEQIAFGRRLLDISKEHNGKIDEKITDF